MIKLMLFYPEKNGVLYLFNIFWSLVCTLFIATPIE